MLIDKDAYKETLTDLWCEVFGDDRSYVELIFNEEYKDSIICFAEMEDDKVVSAFYLLKNTLNFENKLYNGYYLYAAATLPSHRKNGLMASLIKEAQLYCKQNSVDFISLVPSEESLYGYYARYDFKKSMYRNNMDTDIADLIKITPRDYYESRLQIKNNFINFDEKAFSYAVDCFSFIGAAFYRNKCGDILIYIPETDETVEAILSDMNTASYGNLTPFGMIFPINNDLCRSWKYTDIYMNIALD